jgi:pantoate--beta-alanine ligase
VSGPLLRCDDRTTLARELEDARAAGAAIAFVPTMGALHEGHLDLVRRAAELAPHVVISIFVNPTQFDRPSDLAAYPRTLDADLAALTGVAATSSARLVAYVPDVRDVYPDGQERTLRIPEVTEHLCGASRPGHFDGVATVVDALLRAVRPTVLIMGRKDHQQLVVVQRLVAQQGHDVQVVAAPTVRDADGVAISSRNALLDAGARVVARRIPHALAAGVAAVRAARAAGEAVLPADVRAAAAATLAGDGLRIDYLATVDPDRIAPVDTPLAPDDRLLLAVAAFVATEEQGDGVRLIDNVLLGDVADEQRLLDALVRTGDRLVRGPAG